MVANRERKAKEGALNNKGAPTRKVRMGRSYSFLYLYSVIVLFIRLAFSLFDKHAHTHTSTLNPMIRNKG